MIQAVSHNTYFLCDTKHSSSESILYVTSIVMWIPELERIMTVARCRHERIDQTFYFNFFCNWMSVLEEDGVDVLSFLCQLTGALFDFSTGEAFGYHDMLIKYLGQDEGERRFWQTVKGCYVHRLRSCERVAKILCQTEDELNYFMKNCQAMPTALSSTAEVVTWFKVIEAKYPGSKAWVDWWLLNAESLHVKMLVCCCSENVKFNELPRDTNAAKEIHNQYRRILNVNIQIELGDMFDEDRLFYSYFFASSTNVRTTYRNRTEAKRIADAKQRREKRYHNDGRAPDTIKQIIQLPENEMQLALLFNYIKLLKLDQGDLDSLRN
ncbi:hypothetical protein AKO1_002254, partial [Acrasis kona]